MSKLTDFKFLLTGFAKNKNPVTLYMFAQSEPLFGRITSVYKDYISFTNIPKEAKEATIIYLPLTMICGVVPIND